MNTKYFNEGLWHKLVGILPQYNHMKGTPMYEEYMKGYNYEK